MVIMTILLGLVETYFFYICTSLTIVSTPPRSLIAEYASMETTSSTALQLTWDHPLCDYGVRTGYTVYTLLTLRE